MGSNFSPSSNKKTKQTTLEELFFSRIPFSKKPINTIKDTPVSLLKSKSQSRSSPLCQGISLSTGLPCRRPVVDDNYCFQHKTQVKGESIFGIPTTPRKNVAPYDCGKVKGGGVHETLNKDEVTRNEESLAKNFNTVSLKNSNDPKQKVRKVRSKDKMPKKSDFESKKDSPSTTVIMIRLENNVEVQITQSNGTTEVTQTVETPASYTKSGQRSPTPVIRSETPPPLRLPLESPNYPDDSFLETKNKEFFQTPTFVSPSECLDLVPILSSSPTQSIRGYKVASAMTDNFTPLFSSPVSPSREEPFTENDNEDSPPSSPTPIRNQRLLYESRFSPSEKCVDDDRTPTAPKKTFRSVSRSGSATTTPTLSDNKIHVDLTANPISPLKPLTQIFCQGKSYKTNKQCVRKVKRNEKYCQQHKQTMMEQAEIERALFVPGRSKMTWVKFKDWLNDGLSEETKRLLISEMEKPISDRDRAGFIYAYRLVEGPSSHHDSNCTLYKIGRTTNVHRRLYQWSQHCGYTPQLIELFPDVNLSSSFSSQESMLDTIFDDDEGSSNGECSSQLAKVTKCKYAHRVERLIHIELSEKYSVDMETCLGCGNMHREWFKVIAPVRGSSTKVEDDGLHGWNEIRKVIVHWITYVEKNYGVG
ncbi:11739_t:CDS:2 [Acaulospora colombiana]|uniref:11739_t:CDS:1 n=1 Tax=Acaulospora colombiana TaxID=27376 RepID=A0ACA9KWL9_9GLOM|nr:11739_t:CDS:2 [Acaulospora colombiana]